MKDYGTKFLISYWKRPENRKAFTNEQLAIRFNVSVNFVARIKPITKLERIE